jgi:hypothetical protein
MSSTEGTLTNEQRLVLYEVGEELIPEGSSFPSADGAGVPGHFIDRVLALRPDLVAPLGEALDRGIDLDARGFCEDLRREVPAAFELLTFAIAGSYFLNPKVRRAYGYAGQVGESQEGEPQAEYAEGGLLADVVRRGPIYRTP